MQIISGLRTRLHKYSVNRAAGPLGLITLFLFAPPLKGVASLSPWNVYSYSPNGHLAAHTAPAGQGQIATFAFPSDPTAALLTTTSDPALLGNLTGKTLSASAGVAVTSTTTPTFVYWGEGTPSNPCSPPATVRLFFSTSAKTYSPSYAAKPANETNYWWSNPMSAVLSPTLSATISDSLTQPANWSDGAGHFASDPAYTSRFYAAIAHVRQIGVSFGGGCFADNGVGVTGGTATFDLTSYSVG